MSSEEDKPPAPPVRLTSNRGGVGIERVPIPGSGTGVAGGVGDAPPVDMRPLPKGKRVQYVVAIGTLNKFLFYCSNQRARRCGSQEEDAQEQDQRLKTLAHGFQTKYIVSH